MIQPLTEVFVTDDNIAKYSRWLEEYKRDTTNNSIERIMELSHYIDQLKSRPRGTFYTSTSEPDTFKIKVFTNNIKKVVILYNRNCASSCETLVAYGKQSNKVIGAGENSGGFMAYGEVSGIETPCFGFRLNTTSTRTKEYLPYEVVGITPELKLGNHSDWIEQVISFLNKIEQK
jgi:hypothetical protein